MIIKYTKNTKKNRLHQVVEGDYKELIHEVNNKNAEVSNEYEMESYKNRLCAKTK